MCITEEQMPVPYDRLKENKPLGPVFFSLSYEEITHGHEYTWMISVKKKTKERKKGFPASEEAPTHHMAHFNSNNTIIPKEVYRINF